MRPRLTLRGLIRIASLVLLPALLWASVAWLGVFLLSQIGR